jgi:LysR family glycine cleavage system transcriptional activator
MRRRLPPLKALPAFEIAADRLSFTEAAGELHLTHGAVSRQIKALESHLGVPLFRRRNRRIELTEAGVAFLPGVRQALHLLETSTAQVATSPREGALVVSCLATFMMRWLIPRLYAFNTMHRKIQVRLSASHLPVDFARDGIDVAIRLGRAPWPRNVVAAPFLADRIGPVCAPTLLKGRKSLRISDLRRHRLLHAETRAEAWSDWGHARDATIEGSASPPMRWWSMIFSRAASSRRSDLSRAAGLIASCTPGKQPATPRWRRFDRGSSAPLADPACRWRRHEAMMTRPDGRHDTGSA